MTRGTQAGKAIEQAAKIVGATKMLPRLREEAKKRQAHHGGTAPGKSTKSLPSNGTEVLTPSEAIEQAAKIVGATKMLPR